MQEHISFQALGTSAASSNVLVIFKAYMDKSSKNIATFNKSPA